MSIRICQPPSRFCKAATAGAAALELIHREQDASVIGVTSAGVFVQLKTRRVVFLSEGKGWGPLSIYMGGSCPTLKEGLEPGIAVRCEGREIFFSQTGLLVSCEGLEGWVAVKPGNAASSYNAQAARLDALARAAIKDRDLRGVSALLPAILALEFETPQSKPLEQARNVNQALEHRDANAVLQALVPFYGLGPGLTPSGDDFIIGILLMLSRWEPEGWDTHEMDRLKQGVVEEAFRRTTALSASLIECAAGGQADVRLIHAADHLACREPGIDESLAGLLDWGSSSGLDTLTGMAVAVLATAHD